MDKIVLPEDYKYVIAKPDPNFSPKRNKAIIDETIKGTEKFFKDIVEKIDDGMGDRIDILSSYARYRFNQGHKDFGGYVGKKLRNELIGEKILSKVRVMDTVNRLNGNDKYKKFITL